MINLTIHKLSILEAMPNFFNAMAQWIMLKRPITKFTMMTHRQGEDWGLGSPTGKLLLAEYHSVFQLVKKQWQDSQATLVTNRYKVYALPHVNANPSSSFANSYRKIKSKEEDIRETLDTLKTDITKLKTQSEDDFSARRLYHQEIETDMTADLINLKQVTGSNPREIEAFIERLDKQTPEDTTAIAARREIIKTTAIEELPPVIENSELETQVHTRWRQLYLILNIDFREMPYPSVVTINACNAFLTKHANSLRHQVLGLLIKSWLLRYHISLLDQEQERCASKGFPSISIRFSFIRQIDCLENAIKIIHHFAVNALPFDTEVNEANQTAC